jgi:hypothetical protein
MEILDKKEFVRRSKRYKVKYMEGLGKLFGLNDKECRHEEDKERSNQVLDTVKETNKFSG